MEDEHIDDDDKSRYAHLPVAEEENDIPPSSSSNCLYKTLSLYPFVLAAGLPVSAVLSLCGAYLAYCIRMEISPLAFVAAMMGIGLGLGLFTVIVSLCCAYCKRTEDNRRNKKREQEPAAITDIEMQIADAYENEHSM